MNFVYVVMLSILRVKIEISFLFKILV